MRTDPNKSLQEIAAEVPGAVAVLESCGLDYCQPARHPLVTVCAERGLALEGVLTRLEAADPGPDRSQVFGEWSDRSLADLVAHIVRRHHTLSWRELGRLTVLFEEAATTKSRRRRDWKRLQKVFTAFRQKLEQQMNYEEQVLFPYVVALEQAAHGSGAFPSAPFLTVRRPVRMILLDHDASTRLLRRIQAAMTCYHFEKSHAQYCHDLRSILAMLQDDLASHFFLESNLLFPRVVNLESSVAESLRPLNEN